MVKLKTFKEKNRLTYREIAEMFEVSDRTIMNWIAGGADITGKKGDYVIHVTRSIKQPGGPGEHERVLGAHRESGEPQECAGAQAY